jgi:hypothetical protein
MTDAGDRGGGLSGGSGAAGDEHGRREPSPDLMDPRGSMGMPKIVSRAANALGRGPQGGGSVVLVVYVLSVLAIIIALGIIFVV